MWQIWGPTFQPSWWCGRVTLWANIFSFTHGHWMNSSHDDSHWTGFANPPCSCPLPSTSLAAHLHHSEPSPKCSREHHPPGNMVSSGNHLLQWRWGIALSREMRLRPGRASLSPKSQPPSPPSHILKHFYYQEGSICKFHNLSAGSLCKEC